MAFHIMPFWLTLDVLAMQTSPDATGTRLTSLGFERLFSLLPLQAYPARFVLVLLSLTRQRRRARNPHLYSNADCATRGFVRPCILRHSGPGLNFTLHDFLEQTWSSFHRKDQCPSFHSTASIIARNTKNIPWLDTSLLFVRRAYSLLVRCLDFDVALLQRIK